MKWEKTGGPSTASIATFCEEQWIALTEGSRHCGFVQFVGTEIDMVSSLPSVERISVPASASRTAVAAGV